jgi:hypothetical protein
MFDRTVLISGGSQNHYHNHNTKITEHRAPTDKSVELLNEFQDKAAKNLVKSIIIEDNIVNGTLQVYREPQYQRYAVYAKFKINGHEYEINDHLKWNCHEQDPIKWLYDNVSMKITEMLIMTNTKVIDDFVSATKPRGTFG